MLYCLKCNKRATVRHKCSAENYVTVSKELIPVVKKLNKTEIEVLNASCCVYPRENGLIPIRINIDFNKRYFERLLPNLPSNWIWYEFLDTSGYKKHSDICHSEDTFSNKTKAQLRVNTVINDLLE